MDTADSDGDGTYSGDELNALTKAQISSLAAELGYDGIVTSMTKAEMITAFLDAQAGAGG